MDIAEQERRKAKIRESINSYIDIILINNFPETKTGDIDPLVKHHFDEVLDRLINNWVFMNVQMNPQEKSIEDLEKDIEDWYHNEEIDPDKVDRATALLEEVYLKWDELRRNQ